MKCEEFRENITELLYPEEASENIMAMEAHKLRCGECASYYAAMRETVTAVTPRLLPVVVAKRSHKERGETQGRKPAFRLNLFRAATAVAASVIAVAAVITAAIYGPGNARAAGSLFDRSMKSTANVKSMVITLNVRTLPCENFAYIDRSAAMVSHRITVLPGIGGKWRIDKGCRIASFDGTNTRMWGSTGDMGWIIAGNESRGFTEWFALLLDPALILAHEKAATTAGKGARYDIAESDTIIMLSVKVPAQGYFTNSYLLGSSIEESDTRREYTFDKATSLVRSISIYLCDGPRETLILETSSIAYDVPVDETLFSSWPEGYTWNDMGRDTSDPAFSGISAEKAAEMVFMAMQENRLDDVAAALSSYNIKMLKENFSGLKLVGLGKSFRSGQYPGVFVPYEIVLPDGKVERHNIALRNDNPSKTWKVDGGL